MFNRIASLKSCNVFCKFNYNKKISEEDNYLTFKELFLDKNLHVLKLFIQNEFKLAFKEDFLKDESIIRFTLHTDFMEQSK